MSDSDKTTTTTTAKPRTIGAVASDLAAARARFRELEPQNRDAAAKRRRAVDRRRALEAKHAAETPDHPFDPELYTPPAYVPDEDTPLAREFHKLHYTIAGLETELEAAKGAATRS